MALIRFLCIDKVTQEAAGWAIEITDSSHLAIKIVDFEQQGYVLVAWGPASELERVRGPVKECANILDRNYKRVAADIAYCNKVGQPVDWCWGMRSLIYYAEWHVEQEVAGVFNQESEITHLEPAIASPFGTKNKKPRAKQFESDWEVLSPDGKLLQRTAPVAMDIMKITADLCKGDGK